LANPIFSDLRSTDHVIRQVEQSILPTDFDRIRGGLRLLLPAGRGSPTVSLRLLDFAACRSFCLMFGAFDWLEAAPRLVSSPATFDKMAHFVQPPSVFHRFHTNCEVDFFEKGRIMETTPAVPICFLMR